MNAYFLVFDAGTGAGRCAVVDQQGNILSQAYQEWVSCKDPDFPNFFQFSPENHFNILCLTARKALRDSGISSDFIKAVTVSSLREGVVFVNSKGVEIYGGLNFDERAIKEGAQLEADFGHEIYLTSGTYPPVYGYAARAKWFQNNAPWIYDDIYQILTLGDWVIWKLCREYLAEPSLASASGLFDVKNRKWSYDLCDSLEFQADWLPPVHNAGEIIGNVTKEIADEIGLEPHTPVVIAGGDTQCAMVGMGLLSRNRTGCVAGSTSPVQMVTEKPFFDPQMHTWTNCHLASNLWCLESNAIVTGLSIRWLRDTFFPGMDYEQLNILSASASMGSKGTMAFLGAELMDMPNYTAAWTGGFLFQVPPSEIGLGELIRSAWESIAYAVRGNIEQIIQITGEEIKELNVCGGQTSSQTGMEILTDVIGILVNIHSSQSSILGAAACAAFGTGLYPSFFEASQQMMSDVKETKPDLKNHEIYSGEYQRWLTHYQKLKKLSDN